MYALPFIAFARLHQAAIAARRRDRTWHYFLWSVLAGLFAGVMLAIAALFVVVLWRGGVWPLAIVAGAIMAVQPIGPFVIRHVLVPLGRVRLAFYVGYVSRLGPDGEGYALCAAAWAFARRPTPAGEVWLLARRGLRVPLGDAEVVMTAFMAAGRGDIETARQLLESTQLLVEVHPELRELAGEWLAVDAAERGAWQELVAAAAALRWPASPLAYLLEGIAARHAGESGAPGNFELRARWLLAPYRRATWALVTAPVTPPRREVAGANDAAAAGDAADTSAVLEPLPRAVAAHLAFRTQEPSAAALAATVRAWDAALADGATHAWLARRALELDAPLGAVDRALRDVAATVTDELARAADTAKLGAPPAGGPVGNELLRRLRHGRLDALETAFTRWADRRTTGDVRPAIDEWREFVALRAAYTAAVTAGGAELRRLAFPHAFSTGSNMAAWLWNARDEYVLSHAISKWLLDEALAVGDAEAIELGHRNCGLAVPTRLGTVGE